MKRILITVIAATLLIAAAMTLTACRNWDNPYEAADKEGDAISVRYLANGGKFAQEETAVLYDLYKLSDVKEENGKKEISIIPPEDDRRSLAGGKGNKDFIVHKDPKSYKLTGWGIVETDANGNPVLNPDGSYKIIGTWDFENDVISIESGKSYSSTTPILTLAAIWSSYYSFEFYMQNESGEWVNIENSTKSNVNTLLYPVWVDGKLDMKNYPEIKGKTFVTAYEDPEMTMEITGNISPESSNGSENIKKIYTTWQDGNWYRIDNGNQFYSINDINGNYIVMQDVIVTKWRASFHKATFNGQILSAKAAGIEGGSDVTISGITASNNIAADRNARSVGMFGKIGANAKISGITFDSVTVKFVGSLSDITERYYGLLAGTVEDGAEFTDVKITNSKIVFNNNNYGDSFFSTFFDTNMTNTINLVADGNIDGIVFENEGVFGVTLEYAGGEPDGYDVSINASGTLVFTVKES